MINDPQTPPDVKEQLPTEQVCAWEVEIHDLFCIVFAATKPKAQWIATKCYWEAFGRKGWPRAFAVRREEFDKSVLRFETPQRSYCEDHVRESGMEP